MIKCINYSFHHTNKYIILATPLILFSLLSSLYLIFSSGGGLLSKLFAVILFFLMLVAFLAGWLYMIKVSLTESDREDPNSLISEFTSGVGEYFLPVAGLLVCAFLTGIIFLALTYFTGMKFIGDIGISSVELTKGLASIETMKEFFAGLSQVQLAKLGLWNILIFCSISLTYFIIMFYSPAMLFKSKNPLKAVFYGLRDLFSRKFVKNVFLFVVIFGVYMLFSTLTTIWNSNIIMHFVFTLLNFYYLVFVSVLVFNYYYINYVKIGANIDMQV